MARLHVVKQLSCICSRVDIETLHAAVEEHHLNAVIVETGAQADELLGDA